MGGLLAIAAIAVGCVQPSYPTGLLCGPARECPPGQTCDPSGRCGVGGPGSAIDGSTRLTDGKPGVPDAKTGAPDAKPGLPDASHLPPDAHGGGGCPTFDTGITYTVTGASGVAIGDLNGDGKNDLVVGTSMGFSILYQMPLGILASPVPTVVPSSLPTQNLVIVDLDGDGHNDLVFTTDQVVVVLQDPTTPGKLLPAQQFMNVPGGQLLGLVVADLDADGVPDVATANMSGGISVWSQDKVNRGTLLAPPAKLGTAGYAGLGFGQFNGDTLGDLVACNQQTNQTQLFLRNLTAPSTFLAPRVLTTMGCALSIATGDFDGDGHDDISLPNSTLIQDPVTGMFVPHAVPANGGGSPMTAADVDGDGKTDLVYLNGPAGMMAIHAELQRPGGPLRCPDVPTDVAGRLAVGDLTGDGRADVAIAGQDGVTVYVQK